MFAYPGSGGSKVHPALRRGNKDSCLLTEERQCRQEKSQYRISHPVLNWRNHLRRMESATLGSFWAPLTCSRLSCIFSQLCFSLLPFHWPDPYPHHHPSRSAQLTLSGWTFPDLSRQNEFSSLYVTTASCLYLHLACFPLCCMWNHLFKSLSLGLPWWSSG